jgi:N-carbamoylputrescine amidase
LKIAFIHMDPRPGEICRNRAAVERGLDAAASHGASWVVTPELCIPGYTFVTRPRSEGILWCGQRQGAHGCVWDRPSVEDGAEGEQTVGTGWITAQPDAWMNGVHETARRKGITLFLSHPERAADGAGVSRLYNSVFVLRPEGGEPVSYRKIKVTGGHESWSSPGEGAVTVDCSGVRVGLLVCADAWFPEVTWELKRRGAQLLVAPSAWPPGFCGPEDTWERRSGETGLPLLVCNRTGRERGANLDYRYAESVVAHGGRRLLEWATERPALLMFDWDMDSMESGSAEFQVAPLEEPS